MGRVQSYAFLCDAAGQSYGHVGDTVYVDPPPTLPPGWTMVEKAGEYRRFHSASEASQWLNGTLPDNGAPVLRPVEQRYVFRCDYPGHPGYPNHEQLYNTTGALPSADWVMMAQPDGTVGYYCSTEHARLALNQWI